ncbi:MAG: thiosulfate oxidation carrier protein SoxY [Thiothrix sp.]
MLTPRMVLADGSAFDAKTLDDTLKAMAITPEESGDVKIKAPEIAENGAVVPVTVTGPEGTTELSILAGEQPQPAGRHLHPR